MKRYVPLMMTGLLLVFAIGTARAQESPRSLAEWVPADYAGFISLDTSDLAVTLEAMNVAGFTASVLQPTRVDFSPQNDLAGYFPLDTFDLESASFAQLITPWLGDEMLVAWPSLDENYGSGQPLMVLSARDAFSAASAMSPVVRGQDFLEQENYQGATLYQGDQVSLAFTPTAVLVGALDDVRAALDAYAEAADSLADGADFTAVYAGLDADALARLFVHGDAAAGALNFVLNGGLGADVVGAFGGALASLDDDALLAQLAGGGVEAVGVSVGESLLISNALEAQALVLLAQDVVLADAPADSALWEMLPRSAIVAAAGTDAETAVNSFMRALPLASFIPRALAAFPFEPNAASSGQLVPLPSDADILAVVDSFISTLETIGGIDLAGDVLDQASGDYLAAILPRPNNPSPLLNASFDALMIVESPDASALADTLADVVTQFLGVGVLARDGDVIAFNDPLGGDTVFSIAAPEDAGVVLLGTGDAVAQALRAQQGDNRLVDESRWQTLNGDIAPAWYFDVPGIYNLISPSAGGQTQSPVLQLGLAAEQRDDRIVSIRLRVGLNLD